MVSGSTLLEEPMNGLVEDHSLSDTPGTQEDDGPLYCAVGYEFDEGD